MDIQYMLEQLNIYFASVFMEDSANNSQCFNANSSNKEEINENLYLWTKIGRNRN